MSASKDAFKEVKHMVKEEEEESKELEIVIGNPFKELGSSMLRSLDHHKLL